MTLSMYTLIPTVYRALLKSAVSGIGLRIPTTKKMAICEIATGKHVAKKISAHEESSKEFLQGTWLWASAHCGLHCRVHYFLLHTVRMASCNLPSVVARCRD